MILALAGGVGGAKLAAGLQAALKAPAELLTVVNTGDDFEHLGLCISPDLDTVTYTLSGRANPETGVGGSRERPGTSSTRSPRSAAKTGSASATATSPPTSSAPAACRPGRP